MNTPRRIRTVVVSVPVDSLEASEVGAVTRGLTPSARPRFRPSDLLPWSDPYIAGLVRKLQEEVREAMVSTSSRITGEAEMPWNEPFDYESDDDGGFTIDADKLLLK